MSPPWASRSTAPRSRSRCWSLNASDTRMAPSQERSVSRRESSRMCRAAGLRSAREKRIRPTTCRQGSGRLACGGHIDRLSCDARANQARVDRASVRARRQQSRGRRASPRRAPELPPSADAKLQSARGDRGPNLESLASFLRRFILRPAERDREKRIDFLLGVATAACPG
jgi:hypothetical protein